MYSYDYIMHKINNTGCIIHLQEQRFIQTFVMQYSEATPTMEIIYNYNFV